MKENNYNPRISPSYISEDSAIDVRLSAMIEQEVQKLTVQNVEPHLDNFEYTEAEELPHFQEPKINSEKKNGLTDVTLVDTLLILGAVFFGVYAEVLLSQTIFEKVLNVDPKKSFYMSIGITVVLFTCARLIKRSVKNYLQSKSKIPVLFKIGVITSCVMLFVFGGLSYYNTQKNETRKSIILLSQQLEKANEALEDDETNKELQQKVVQLKEQIATKMEFVNSTPSFVKGSSFFALSIFSLVMLFSSSFLKAVSMVYLQLLKLKAKRKIKRAKIYRIRKNYKALKNRALKVYKTSILYLSLVSRKSAIEEALALIPITSEYKEALHRKSNTMRNLGVLIFLLAFSFKTVAQQSSHTLMFIDKSMSMKSSPEQDKYIKKIIKKACKKKTAIVEIGFLNSNTASATGSQIFTYQEPEFDSSLYGADEVELQKELFKGTIRRAKKRFTKKVLTFINSYSASAKWTEILASIVPISRLNKKNVDVFLFTDGLESSRIRDMTKQGFSSERAAISGASLDISKLRKKYQLPKVLKGIRQIEFVFPLNMESENKTLQFLKAYWIQALKKFQYHNVKFETL